MKPRPTSLAAVFLSCCLFTSSAGAHYLWVAIDAKTGKHGVVNVYFEEGPSPGDGQYLDPFVQRGSFWIRTIRQSQPIPLKITDVKKSKKRWLSSKLTSPAPRSLESYAKWGVYRYGQTDVLLHYYAKQLDVSDARQLERLARAEHLALDIAPAIDDGKVRLTVFWNGKPVAGRPVIIRGPKGLKQNLKTDESGQVALTAQGEGRYTFRTNVEEKGRSGKQDGKEYEMVRHHATLTLRLPLLAK